MKVRLLHNLGRFMKVPSHLAGDVIDVNDKLGEELLRRLLAEPVPEQLLAVPAPPEIAESSAPLKLKRKERIDG